MTTAARACRFCEILDGGSPALAVLADETCLAFLDRRPLFPGHCLLVPRGHWETLWDLPGDQVGPLFRRVRLLARAVELGLGAEGVFVAMNNRVSQSVPHLHVHVVPRRRRDGLRGFFWPRHPYADEGAAVEVQGRIRREVERLVGRADPDG